MSTSSSRSCDFGLSGMVGTTKKAARRLAASCPKPQHYHASERSIDADDGFSGGESSSAEKSDESPGVPAGPAPMRVISWLCFHLHTLYLFTRSDLKTVLLPQTVLALSAMLAGSSISASSVPYGLLSASTLLRGTLRAICWIWPNLLMVAVSNQRRPSSIMEDRLNKPWRPLPSGRMSSESAWNLLIAGRILVCILSYTLGGLLPSLSIAACIHLHDDAGFDAGVFSKNIFNALGLVSIGWGGIAASLGASGGGSLTEHGVHWLLMTGAIIATTIHAQDIPDIVGDSARGRKTVPIACGEPFARTTVAGGCVLWSVACLWFWQIDALTLWFGLLSIAGAVGLAFLANAGMAMDERGWRLWCVWMSLVYLIPVFASM